MSDETRALTIEEEALVRQRDAAFGPTALDDADGYGTAHRAFADRRRLLATLDAERAAAPLDMERSVYLVINEDTRLVMAVCESKADAEDQVRRRVRYGDYRVESWLVEPAALQASAPDPEDRP